MPNLFGTDIHDCVTVEVNFDGTGFEPVATCMSREAAIEAAQAYKLPARVRENCFNSVVWTSYPQVRIEFRRPGQGVPEWENWSTWFGYFDVEETKARAKRMHDHLPYGLETRVVDIETEVVLVEYLNGRD